MNNDDDDNNIGAVRGTDMPLAGGGGVVGDAAMSGGGCGHDQVGDVEMRTLTLTESAAAMDLLRKCQALRWRPDLFTSASLEDIQQTREWSVGMTGMVDGALQRDSLARFGAKMPSEAWRVCDSTGERMDFEMCSALHYELVRSAARHVVEIAPFAPCSRALKDRLRRIVGSCWFSPRLKDARAFNDLVEGCEKHMRTTGKRLRRLYLSLIHI